MKTKKIAYFALSTITLCAAIIGITSSNHSVDSNDLAIKINPTNYVHKSIDFNDGEGQYVSNSKVKVDDTKNSIRFISAVKVDMDDNNELSLPGTFGFHIEYEKTIDGETTKVDKMFDVDALYYSYSETYTNGTKVIYGTELSSYYNSHEGAEFKAISEYIEDSSTSYNLFMTVEIRNIPTSELDNSIKVQPYCLLEDGTYDLAKKANYYTFNSSNPKIKINNFKTELMDNTPYFIINSSIKNVTYDQLYLLLELQEGWPNPTYTLKVNKSTTNDDNTTDLYINLDQVLSDGSTLKAGDYIFDLKNSINNDVIDLTNTNDDNMFKSKVVSSSSKSIYEFGELNGNLKLNVTKFSESSYLIDESSIVLENEKPILKIHGYLSDLTKEDFNFTLLALKKDWEFTLEEFNMEINGGEFIVKYDLSNLSVEYEYIFYFNKTDEQTYDSDGNLRDGKSFIVPTQTVTYNGYNYIGSDIWGHAGLKMEKLISYNSYKLENVNNRAILTININIDTEDVNIASNIVNELIFKIQKYKDGSWPEYNIVPLNIENQSNGSFNVSIDISDFETCGKMSTGENEGYLVTLKTSSIDNGSISLGTAPETITIGDKTYSFEDQWGNLKIVINNAN